MFSTEKSKVENKKVLIMNEKYRAGMTDSVQMADWVINVKKMSLNKTRIFWRNWFEKMKMDVQK